jgi:short-subunit dehydrogenase
MTKMQEPGKLDKISYDAPLSFQEPSQKWKNDMGFLKNNRSEFVRDEQMTKADLSGKWVIISGSNNGIGREAALAFARMGANMILACRNPPPTENHPDSVVAECVIEAKKFDHKSTIEWWIFDGADLETVEAFAQRWLQTGRPLDILCNNAGMGSSPGGSDVVLTKDGFEIIHQVCTFLCKTAFRS